MAEERLKRIFIVGGVFLYLGFLLLYVNTTYPWVGHDYRYFLPRLVDTYIHYQQNGLSIQWFTPSFGGGLPAFPNPQHFQFSLDQSLTFLVNPWLATMITVSIFTLIGYASVFRLLRDVIELGWMASSLGALFFISNGMLIQHSVIGSAYEGFPLIGVLFLVLLSRKIPLPVAGMAAGVVMAVWVNSAGFYLFVIFALAGLIGFPLFALLFPSRFDLTLMMKKIFASGVIFLLLSAGKLYAVLSYLQHFPRVILDDYYSGLSEALVGLVMQLVGVPLFTLPLRLLRGDAGAVGQMMTALVGGQGFGLWEMDISISPVLMYILFFQFRKLFNISRVKTFFQRRKTVLTREQWYASLALVFGVWIAFEFTSARGVLYALIRELPVLSSLHNNVRYAGAFILPLALLGAYFYDREFSRVADKQRMKVFSFFFAATLLWLGVYFFIPAQLQSRNFDVSQTLADYRRARAGEQFYVSEVQEVTDNMVFASQASSLHPYEPIFGYALEDFATKLEPGSIYDEENGTYNLTDPRSLVYDSDELFARFSTDEKAMMEQFAHYQQPDWEIPQVQHILNTMSGVSVLVVLGWGGWYWLRRSR